MKNTFQCKIGAADRLTVEHTGSQQPNKIAISTTRSDGMLAGFESVYLTDKQAQRLVDLLTLNIQINKGTPL
jgi:hypothetical protein